MGFISKLLGRESADRITYRIHCRACDTEFRTEGASTADVTCPDCGETDRIFKL